MSIKIFPSQTSLRQQQPVDPFAHTQSHLFKCSMSFYIVTQTEELRFGGIRSFFSSPLAVLRNVHGSLPGFGKADNNKFHFDKFVIQISFHFFFLSLSRQFFSLFLPFFLLETAIFRAKQIKLKNWIRGTKYHRKFEINRTELLCLPIFLIFGLSLMLFSLIVLLNFPRCYQTPTMTFLKNIPLRRTDPASVKFEHGLS